MAALQKRPQTPAKLPFWRTVAASYRLGLVHLPEVIAARWLVLIVMADVSFAAHWLIFPYLKEGAAETWGVYFAHLICSTFLPAVFTAMIAVPWHRRVLNGEPLTGHGLTLDRRMLGYVGWGLVIIGSWLLLYLATPWSDFPTQALAELLTSTPGSSAETLIDWFRETGYAVPLGCVIVYLAFRLDMFVVAIALGQHRGALSAIWRNTSWSFCRLYFGAVISFLPLLLVLPFHVMEKASSVLRVQSAAWAALGDTATIPLGLVGFAFLSLSYRHFMGPLEA
jgi:hypothetical protein